ncbi:SIR2 family protein [Paenibacillus graminis]|uniref:SIR2 family protein n=1 Tax=Paenibacillus graminis TaxID=189425 RepID=UPI002DB7261D|nr:SIR2 family protein [Paenibacillus graminis]MEC0169116.1 SIR2 family protein [Paenibacillus graminis]
MKHISIVTLDQIAEWLRNDQLFFLIGAGFSSSATEPSVGTGKQVAEFLINSIDSELKEVDQGKIKLKLHDLVQSGDSTKVDEIVAYINEVIYKEGITLKQISDRYILSKGEHDYKAKLKDYFFQREKLILPTHKKMASIINKHKSRVRAPFIVSLNIDRLIERAYSIETQGQDLLDSFIGGLGKKNYSLLDHSVLWKFHGCISDIDSVVFNTFSYYKIKEEQEEGLYKLKQLFKTKHCILLGVSLQDDHIRDLIFNLYEDRGMPQGVMVSPQQYINTDFMNYMNSYMSLAHYESEISDFLEQLNIMT